MRIKQLQMSIALNHTSKPLYWTPWSVLQQNTSTNSNYAVVILNTSIYWKPEFLLKFWNDAKIKVLVDGGAQRWHKWIKKHNLSTNDELLTPDLVSGDMDSMDNCLLERIKQNPQIKLVYTPNQNETDFTKALREIKTYALDKKINIESVISVVDSWGRIDHTMANIETLFHSQKIYNDVNVYILASDSLSWLIQPGKHRIEIPEQLCKCWCSLVPIGKKCERIETKGLKWNLDNQSLEFGELVSTSNTYDGLGYVTIDTSDVILWSMGLCGIPTVHEEL